MVTWIVAASVSGIATGYLFRPLAVIPVAGAHVLAVSFLGQELPVSRALAAVILVILVNIGVLIGILAKWRLRGGDGPPTQDP